MIEKQRSEKAGEAQPRLEIALTPLRECLVTHPLYASLLDEESVQIFMETHVFAVWDFQSLLKALQRLLTCVEVPWHPTPDPEARRLINEIVLDEESDEAPAGGHLSHFEIYLEAMRECGANTEPIQSFLSGLSGGLSLEEALAMPSIPQGIERFVTATLGIARSGQPHRIAAAFAYGREEIIPGIFRQLVDRLAAVSPPSWTTLRYYLDRHVGMDSEEHGPRARVLVRKLCGRDEILWSQATEAAQISLEARVRLWDTIRATVGEQKEGAVTPPRSGRSRRVTEVVRPETR